MTLLLRQDNYYVKLPKGSRKPRQKPKAINTNTGRGNSQKGVESLRYFMRKYEKKSL